MTNSITVDRFTVTHSALPGLEFRTSSGAGGERNIAKRRHTSGGAQENIVSRSSKNDLTTTIGYTRDTLDLATRLEKDDLIAGSITRQAKDADDVPIPGASTTYVNCVVKSYSVPDTDVDGEDAGDISIVWSVGGTA